MKNEWKSTKAKRIAQVSFQAKIDASHGSTRARSEAREIQNTTIDASLSQYDRRQENIKVTPLVSHKTIVTIAKD